MIRTILFSLALLLASVGAVGTRAQTQSLSNEPLSIVTAAGTKLKFQVDMISSHGRVLAVLELRGGTVARLGIAKGDWVRHKAFRE